MFSLVYTISEINPRILQTRHIILTYFIILKGYCSAFEKQSMYAYTSQDILGGEKQNISKKRAMIMLDITLYSSADTSLHT